MGSILPFSPLPLLTNFQYSTHQFTSKGRFVGVKKYQWQFQKILFQKQQFNFICRAPAQILTECPGILSCCRTFFKFCTLCNTLSTSPPLYSPCHNYFLNCFVVENNFAEASSAPLHSIAKMKERYSKFTRLCYFKFLLPLLFAFLNHLLFFIIKISLFLPCFQ